MVPETSQNILFIMYSESPDPDPTSEWAVCAMTSTYTMSYLGKIFTYGGSWSGATFIDPTYTGCTAIFGMDEWNGRLLYWKADDLYRDAALIANTGVILGGTGQRAGRAVYARNNGADEIIVVNSTAIGSNEAIVVWTSTGFTGSPTHYDKSGNYESAVAAWVGASGSGGQRGNIGCELFKVYT